MQQQTAFLVMDMQTSILSGFPHSAGLVGTIARAISAARSQHLPIIYVRAGFRKGAPEISPNNKFFFASKNKYATVDPEQWLTIHPAVTPQEEDILVTKRQFGAFAGSDLDLILRAQAIQHLVLTGFSTSGVVLSTVRDAADKNYRLTVLSDGCANRDDEVHRVLVTKVFPRQAEIFTVDEWIQTSSLSNKRF